MKFQPTFEQLAIKDAVLRGENIAVIAGPGSAKTSTSEWIIREYLPASADVLYLTFSGALALSAAERMPSNVYCSTIHSMGYALMRKNYGYGIGDDAKTNRHKYAYNLQFSLADMLEPKTKQFWATKEQLLKLFDFARFDNSDFSDKSLQEVAFEHSMDYTPYAKQLLPKLFEKGIQLATRGNRKGSQQYWDFTDQIRIPVEHKIKPKFGMTLGASKKNVSWPHRGYKYIIVDELQDFNYIQIELLKLILGDAQLIVVGDPMQSIYEFAGSAPGIMQKFIQEMNLNTYMLNTVFRCPSNVVDLLNTKFGTSLVGVKEPSEISTAPWQNFLDDLTPNTAILVRNIRGRSSAFAFIAAALQRGIPLNIRGLEIGKTINRIFKLVEENVKETGITVGWENYPNALREISAAMPRYSRQELDEQITMIQLFLNVSGAETREQFDAFISKYEEDKINAAKFMTGHASKGQEFLDGVIVLDDDTLPRKKKGMSARQLEAEDCIYYVMLSRTMDKLMLATSGGNIIADFDDDEDEE